MRHGEVWVEPKTLDTNAVLLPTALLAWPFNIRHNIVQSCPVIATQKRANGTTAYEWSNRVHDAVNQSLLTYCCFLVSEMIRQYSLLSMRLGTRPELVMSKSLECLSRNSCLSRSHVGTCIIINKQAMTETVMTLVFHENGPVYHSDRDWQDNHFSASIQACKDVIFAQLA